MKCTKIWWPNVGWVIVVWCLKAATNIKSLWKTNYLHCDCDSWTVGIEKTKIIISGNCCIMIMGLLSVSCSWLFITYFKNKLWKYCIRWTHFAKTIKASSEENQVQNPTVWWQCLANNTLPIKPDINCNIYQYSPSLALLVPLWFLLYEDLNSSSVLQ